MFKFLKIIELKFKFNLFFLLILMSFAALLEMVGLSILPVIISQVISDQSISNFIFFDISEYIDLDENFSTLLYGVIFFYLIKNIFLSAVYYFELKFIYDLRKYNSKNLFSYYIFLPFSEFTKKNSSEFIKNISIENHNACTCLMLALNLLRESLVVLFIFILLFISSSETTIYAIFFLVLFFLIWILGIKKKIYEIGKLSQSSRGKFIKNLNESFNSFKEIKIFSTEKKIIKEFIKNFSNSEKYILIESFIAKLPRLILETLVIVLLFSILAIYFFDGKNNFNNNLNVIILFSIAIVRLIPSFSTLSSSFLKMRFLKPALEVIYNEKMRLKKIEKKLPIKNSKFENINKLSLDNVSFSYDQKNQIIKDFNLEIHKGDKILIQGESGSGKTTLINLICGLLEPTKGKILLNESRYKKILGNINIGYVSQNIYLIDDSIEENIKFNSDRDDEATFSEVIKICKISEFLDKTRNEKSGVGEAGSKLSGGQRQRIALARALYNKPDILILDEGTSGIDQAMEKIILNDINKFNKNLILMFISHRNIDQSFFNKRILVEKNTIKI